MGAFADFEHSPIRERREREGIALAQQRGAYKRQTKTLERATLGLSSPGWASNGTTSHAWPLTSPRTHLGAPFRRLASHENFSTTFGDGLADIRSNG